MSETWGQLSAATPLVVDNWEEVGSKSLQVTSNSTSATYSCSEKDLAIGYSTFRRASESLEGALENAYTSGDWKGVLF